MTDFDCGFCQPNSFKVVQFRDKYFNTPREIKIEALGSHTDGTGVVQIVKWDITTGVYGALPQTPKVFFEQLVQQGLTISNPKLWVTELNIGETFTFTPTQDFQWISVYQRNVNNLYLGSPYWDCCCVQINIAPLILSIVDFGTL